MKSLNAPAGFTMIEVLLALLGTSLCVLLCTQVAGVVANTTIGNDRVEDEIAVKQLQLILAQSEIQSVEADMLSFYYHEDIFRLVLYKDKLVKRKGYEVILQNIDELRFEQKNACVFLHYRRGNDVFTAELACEE